MQDRVWRQKERQGRVGSSPMSQQDADRSHSSQQRCPSTLGRPSAVPMTSTVQSRGGHLTQLAQRAFPSACGCLQSCILQVPEEKGQRVCRKRERWACQDTQSRQEEDGRSPDLTVPCSTGSRCDSISVLKAIGPLVSYNKVPFWFKLRKLGFCH